MIVSDNPMDYLLLYRNASEVYSDRVHACIPTLAFGNKARLFSNSPRIALFENAKIPDVRERLVSIEGLKEMQDKQIAFLASLFRFRHLFITGVSALMILKLLLIHCFFRQWVLRS